MNTNQALTAQTITHAIATGDTAFLEWHIARIERIVEGATKLGGAQAELFIKGGRARLTQLRKALELA